MLVAVEEVERKPDVDVVVEVDDGADALDVPVVLDDLEVLVCAEEEREPVLTVVVVLPVEERVVVVVAVVAEREPDSAGAFARDELLDVAADLDALPVVADLDALLAVADLDALLAAAERLLEDAG